MLKAFEVFIVTQMNSRILLFVFNLGKITNHELTLIACVPCMEIIAGEVKFDIPLHLFVDCTINLHTMVYPCAHSLCNMLIY